MYDDDEGILACTRAEKLWDGAFNLCIGWRWECREGPGGDMMMTTSTRLSWISMIEVERLMGGWTVTQRWGTG